MPNRAIIEHNLFCEYLFLTTTMLPLFLELQGRKKKIHSDSESERMMPRLKSKFKVKQVLFNNHKCCYIWLVPYLYRRIDSSPLNVTPLSWSGLVHGRKAAGPAHQSVHTLFFCCLPLSLLLPPQHFLPFPVPQFNRFLCFLQGNLQ